MFRNTLFNIIGMLIPGLISIPAMGYLSRGLDVEFFGLLMLIFSILGYSGLFDAGISRAVIRKIAIVDDIKVESEIMGTALISVFLLSIIALLAVFFNADGITSLLNVGYNKQKEVIVSIKLLSFIIPFFLIGTISFSFLEGKQRFFELNKYKVLTGILITTFPVIFVYFYHSLFSAIFGLFISRVIVSIISFYSCFKYLKKEVFVFKWNVFIELITFGGWVSLSNIISPLMVSSDRFILSNYIGADKVAFFTAPMDLIQKVSIIPGALSKTIYPYFSKSDNLKNKVEFNIYISLVFVLLCFLIPLFLYSENILSLWLGHEYGNQSYITLRILIVGFFFNALAQIPFSKIQAIGLSKTTALIHLIEIIPYIIMLIILIREYGMIGAAVAWSVRVFIDFLLLELISQKLR